MFKKKMAALFSIGILLSSVVFSTLTYAQSPVQSPSMIDGAYVTGTTNFYSNPSSKFATANTIHTINTTKTAKVRGHYYYNAIVYSTAQKSNSSYSDPNVTVNVDYPSSDLYTPCGSSGTHIVIGNSGSWTGYSSTGITP